MTQKIYPIPPGLFCVPSALCAVTGKDPISVIIPALNRHQKNGELFGPIAGVYNHVTEAVLKELGYQVRHAKDRSRKRLRSWANISEKRNYPYPMLVATRKHMLVVYQGRVYDTMAPHGPRGEDHPCRDEIVRYAAIVVKGN